MLKVYHNDNFLNRGLDTTNMSGDRCLFAAEVAAKDLQEGFLLTNSIMRSWLLNDRVKPTYLSRRSTSVGDIIAQGSKKYVVESEGFRKLSPEETASIEFVELCS